MTIYRARKRSTQLIGLSLVVVALAVGTLIGIVVASSDHRPIARHRSTNPPARRPTSVTQAPAILSLSAVSPTDGTTQVPPTNPITASFSFALAKNSPLPSLIPPTPGAWHIKGASLSFQPSTAFVPLTEMTLAIPGGPTGVQAANGGHLSQSVIEHFRIENGSVLRLQQLLSLLDYSPLAWTPTATPIGSQDANAQQAALYSPPAGLFTWRNRAWPVQLRALWKPSEFNVFTRGLVMSFQADHGLNPNGHVGPGVWSALLAAVANNSGNSGGYNYALAHKSAPELLTIYHNGHVILQSPANTGISTSPTPNGTFPVYTRLRRQVMRGSNPNGSRYADLVQFIAYFHGNDAVHYMSRADYGIPQSLGCIELPLVDAAHAWPYLAYGTLVTVIN